MVTSTVQNMMQWPPMKQLAGNTHHYILIQYNIMKPALSLYILCGLSTQCLSSSCAYKYIIMVCLNILEHDEHVLHHLIFEISCRWKYNWIIPMDEMEEHFCSLFHRRMIKCICQMFLYGRTNIHVPFHTSTNVTINISIFRIYNGVILDQGRIPDAMWFLWWCSIQGPVSRFSLSLLWHLISNCG